MTLTRKLTALVLLTALIAPFALAEQPTTPAPTKTQPKLISGHEPKYTEAAREAKIEGTVILTVNVNEKGKVTAVKVKNSLDKGLDRNAVSTVKHWRFTPATVDGKPVTTEVNISVDFRLYQ